MNVERDNECEREGLREESETERDSCGLSVEDGFCPAHLVDSSPLHRNSYLVLLGLSFVLHCTLSLSLVLSPLVISHSWVVSLSPPRRCLSHSFSFSHSFSLSHTLTHCLVVPLTGSHWFSLSSVSLIVSLCLSLVVSVILAESLVSDSPSLVA